MIPLTESSWPADPSEPVLDLTIAGILRHAAAEAPDRIALVAGVPEPELRTRRTYAQLLDEAERVAYSLSSRFEAGERVAVWAPSIPESLVLTFAMAMARLVLVPVNPALRDDETRHILQSSGAAGIFLVSEHRGNDLAGTLERIRPDLPALREVIDFGDWPILTRAASPEPLPPPEPDDVAQIIFTSGTTGAPKGAALTHRAMCNAARVAGIRFGIEPGDVYVMTIPLFHTGGQGVSLEICLGLATNILVRQFEPGLQLELLETERATLTVGVPSMLLAMIEHPDFGRRDVGSLRAVSSGGAVVPAALIRHIESTLDVQSTIVFGQTEACGFISQTHLDDAPEDKAATLGQLLPQIEGRVVDGDDAVVPVGEIGELHIRGFNVMVGYHDQPAETAAAIDTDGWLHTGDLVTMDDRGFLRIAGRKKDMVVTGGVNVYPAEIEDVIATHPKVAQVAVIGRADRQWGEAVVAVVRLTPGSALDPAALDAFARERLARHKVPKDWVFVDEMPVNASGKVQKFLLREQLDRDR
ncbi:MAG: AMP-dependent synthetase and ligase [Actinomycetia bacterium]|nr:AMP-dependent synthetase and ligase [Actinomycetes bacterium]